MWFTNKNLLSVNARPNCRRNKQLILSNDTRLFYNNSFLLKSRKKGLHDYRCLSTRTAISEVFFFFRSLHSAFCDPRVMTTNGERNFDLQTRLSFEISLTQTKCWKFRLKFCSHLRNFERNFARTNEI